MTSCLSAIAQRECLRATAPKCLDRGLTPRTSPTLSSTAETDTTRARGAARRIPMRRTTPSSELRTPRASLETTLTKRILHSLPTMPESPRLRTPKASISNRKRARKTTTGHRSRTRRAHAPLCKKRASTNKCTMRAKQRRRTNSEFITRAARRPSKRE